MVWLSEPHAGIHRLDPSTIILPISPVAAGRFRDMYKATSTDPDYNMELAVKLFRDIKSYQHELKIYTLPTPCCLIATRNDGRFCIVAPSIIICVPRHTVHGHQHCFTK